MKAEFPDGRGKDLPEYCIVIGDGRPRCKGCVQGVPLSSSCSPFICSSRVWVVVATVDGAVENPVGVEEGLLGTVPVVHVPVHDGDPFDSAKGLRRRDSNVVEEAEPHGMVPLGMVPRG